MDINKQISKKIDQYGSRGGIGQTVILYIAIAKRNHKQVKIHSERVALMAEEVAVILNKDTKAAFLGGIFHDIGKITLPSGFFKDDVVITPDEYNLIKTHAVNGFEILKDIHPFCALCAGLHHAVYDNGYGISVKDVPNMLGIKTLKDAIEIATIISVCDFIDAFTHRKTHIMDMGDKSKNLKDLLLDKYHNDQDIVIAALDAKKYLAI